MEPSNPYSFTHKLQRLSTGKTYHFVDEKPSKYDSETTRTILAIHGFPDLWYGFRKQIGPWTRKGYRVVVPDMLGYGGTDKPENHEEYSTKRLSDDLRALLDFLEVNKAIVIGHDWGSFIAGRFALWCSDRVSALVMLSVPFTPPSREYISVEQVGRKVPNLGYQSYFADPRNTKKIEANVREFIRVMFQPPDTGHPFFTYNAMKDLSEEMNVADRGPSNTLLTPGELHYYHAQFKQGMTGPLSYYRTAKTRHEEEEAADLPSSLPSDLPVLFICGTQDPTCTPIQAANARKFIPCLQSITFQGKGHWLLIEVPQIAEVIANWLDPAIPYYRTGKL